MTTISVDDVAVLLGRALTPTEADRAERLLEMAEGQIESAFAGLAIAPGSEVVTLLDDQWTPHYPVAVVNSLTTADGTELDASRYTFDDLGRFRWASYDPALDWEINFSGRVIGMRPFTIDYDFGFPEAVSPDIASAAAGAVAAVIRRQTTNPGNLLSESTGPFSVSYGASEQEALAAGLVVDTSSLKRWSRKRFTSVPAFT